MRYLWSALSRAECFLNNFTPQIFSPLSSNPQQEKRKKITADPEILLWVRSRDAHMLYIMVNPNSPQFFINIIMGEEQGCAHVIHNG
jgi:hypothetical protein